MIALKFRNTYLVPSPLRRELKVSYVLWLGMLVGLSFSVVGCLNRTEHDKNIEAEAHYPNARPASIPVGTTDRLREEQIVLDEIDKFAAKFSVAGLRGKSLSPGETELRIWIGFGPDKTRGLVIDKTSAIYLAPIGDVGNEKVPVVQKLTSTTDIKFVWNDINTLGLLDLSPEPESEEVEPRNDSDVILVETMTGSKYKYNLYGAPCYSRGRNAEQLISAIKRISRGVSLDFYRCSSD